LAEVLKRAGFFSAALSGTVLGRDHEIELGAWLAAKGHEADPVGGVIDFDVQGVRAEQTPYLRLEAHGVPIFLHPSPTTLAHEPDEAERRAFLSLLDQAFQSVRPEIVVSEGTGSISRD